MKNLSRKMLAGLLAGAVITASGMVYAAGYSHNSMPPRGEMRGGMHHRQASPYKEEAAAKMAEYFGLDKSEIEKTLQNGTDFRVVGRAAMLAKVSGKSFSEVLALKTDSNKWSDVTKSLGVTREQIKREMESMLADHIAKQGNIDKSAAAKLIRNGYEGRDIEMAARIAKAAGKDVQSVLDMKKINNRWHDVAKSCGVDAKILRPAHNERGGVPHNDGHGFSPEEFESE